MGTPKAKVDQKKCLACGGCISVCPQDAIAMIVNGFCKNVFKELPLEFAVEAKLNIDYFRYFYAPRIAAQAAGK